MRKPSSLKLVSVVIALIALVASVAFAYFWPDSQTLKLSSEVQAREIRTGSRLGGRVKKILVQEGQTVKQGQVLIIFDDIDLQAKIADARATLSQAMAQERMLAKGADLGAIRSAGSSVQQAQERLKMLSAGARPEEIAQAKSKLKLAESQYNQTQQTAENARVMLEEGIISRQKYENIQESLEAARSNVDSARAALNMMQSGGRAEERRIAGAQLSAVRAQYSQVLQGARPEEMSIASANVEKARSNLKALEAQLDEVQIKVPFPGIVSVIGVTEGELVPPGRPVISIIDYGHLWTDVFVPESQLSMMTLGMPVTVRARSYKGAEFQGRVAMINPKSEFIPNSGGDTSTEESTFRVKVSVTGKDKAGRLDLYPGMKVDVFFKK